MLLEISWLILSSFFIGIPLGYYFFMVQATKKDWNLKIDPNYKPNVSILIPTYNEETMIQDKLNNLIKVDYPQEKIEIIIVDSSIDSTLKYVDHWMTKHPNIQLNIVREKGRVGKGKALNKALPHVNGEIIVITDADCIWEPQALREAINILSDPSVATVTALKKPLPNNNSSAVKAEETYRDYYNIIRVGESKLYSTTISHGELGSFKRTLLNKFEDSIGADDSGTAMNMIRKGYRSILSPKIVVYEHSSPTWKGRFKQKIRRAQHCIQMFRSNLDLINKKRGPFSLIMAIESYLHIINPILLIPLFITSTLMVYRYVFLLIPITFLLLIPKTRKLAKTWMVENITLLIAMGKEIRGKRELVWDKVTDYRN